MRPCNTVQGAPAIWKLEDPAALQQVSPPSALLLSIYIDLLLLSDDKHLLRDCL